MDLPHTQTVFQCHFAGHVHLFLESIATTTGFLPGRVLIDVYAKRPGISIGPQVTLEDALLLIGEGWNDFDRRTLM